MRVISWSTILLAPLLVSVTPRSATAQETAQTIYHGGSILTMAGGKPAYVEALAVKDGMILFAGSKDQALAMKSDATKLVDLAGKALLPAFIDAHGHYINSLLVANQAKLYAPPSGPGKDVPSIIAELKKFATERKIHKGEMIMGYGYDDSVMPDGRLLNRDDLDEAFPDNPVRVDHVSMHGAVMNSLFTTFGWTLNDIAPQVDAACEGNWTPEYMLEVGERIWNMERIFNNRAGLTSKDDTLPPRLLKEAAKTGPAKGLVNGLDKMLPEYYQLRGWTTEGVPTNETLARLSL